MLSGKDLLPDSSVQQVYGSVQLPPGTTEADAKQQVSDAPHA